MAEADADAEAETEKISDGVPWKRALRTTTGESVSGYLLKYVAPTALGGLVVSVVLLFLLGDLLGSLSPIVFVIPLFLTFVVGVYPKVVADRRRVEIEQMLHLFITDLGVLSSTNIPRVDVFTAFAEQEEYGAVAEEMRKIVELVQTWNMSLDEAARFQAKRTPSPILSDFLERLAYNIGAGQDMEEFLMEEQNVVMSQYETMYKGSLDNVDIVVDLFLSMSLSTSFVIVFATIIPILTGSSPLMLLGGGVFLYAFIEVGFLYGTLVLIPNDPVWYHPEETTDLDRKILFALGVGIGLTAVASLVAAGAYFGYIPDLLPFNIPIPFYVALPVTPLIYPGAVVYLEEKRIKNRDEEFPSFLRSLGASEHAKQSTTTKVLETLSKKDFGKLTDEIRNLYNRLNMRIDQELAWEHFSRETRSYLAQKGSEMYRIGRSNGGNTKRISNVISDNLETLGELRQSRKQTAVNFMGVMYGMTAANVFAFFIGIEVVDLMVQITDEVSMPQEGPAGQLLYTQVYDITSVTFIILALILVNAVLGSLMIKVVDGGNKISAFVHLVALTWVGALVATVTRIFVSGFISVG
ncbi:archaellar assembly protein FlaJ [Halorutilales archaeon Cl-col2-1]